LLSFGVEHIDPILNPRRLNTMTLWHQTGDAPRPSGISTIVAMVAAVVVSLTANPAQASCMLRLMKRMARKGQLARARNKEYAACALMAKASETCSELDDLQRRLEIGRGL
jgi:hypothetical protein